MTDQRPTQITWYDAFIEAHTDRMKAVEDALDELDRKVGAQPSASSAVASADSTPSP